MFKSLFSPRLLVAAIAALILGAAAAWFTENARLSRPSPAMEGLLWPPPKTLDGFALVDQSGASFTPQQLEGRWSLLFFGFTHCPDVCPNTLRLLQKAAPGFPSDTQVVFVSVDPERDTPDAVAEYVRFFDPAFVGVTGSTTAMADFTRSLGVLSMRTEPDEHGNYSVDHSAGVLLVDPKRRLVGIISQPFTAESLARLYLDIREFVEGKK
jgi:protein SCO1/2